MGRKVSEPGIRGHISIPIARGVVVSPSRRDFIGAGGAVAALEDIATPAAVAKAVMDRTDHIMLVGAGAKKFALEMGFKEEKSVNVEAHEEWLRWKSRLNPNGNWIDLH